MQVELESALPEAVVCELLAVPFGGEPPAILARLAEAAQARLASFAADATAEPGKIAVLNLSPQDGAAAIRLALVGVGKGAVVDEDAVRSAAAVAARTAAAFGGTVVWAFDPGLALEPAAQARAVVEGALLGSYAAGRWKTGPQTPGVDRFVLAGAPASLAAVVDRAVTLARWTNRARELVDAPPNELTPLALGEAASTLLGPLGVQVEVLAGADIERLSLGGLAAVGRGSVNEPCLIVLRVGTGTPALGLVGKAVTFDSGGFFLKGQADIVKQKADMAGGAAVLAAIGAIAELGLPLSVLGVLPAAENMIGGAAFRPGDIVTTAAGLTVEITNPDAEGRLILADALWFAARAGATRLADVATLTGATRGALGDRYIAVFGNDDEWRSRIVAAGDESGDWAWPMPLHPRYHRLLESPLADLRNTAGRSFGYPIVAAAFLERFVDGLPWAHLDIHSTAYLDEERDYLARGATGAGVRLLAELASGLADGSGFGA